VSDQLHLVVQGFLGLVRGSGFDCVPSVSSKDLVGVSRSCELGLEPVRGDLLLFSQLLVQVPSALVQHCVVGLDPPEAAILPIKLVASHFV